MGFTKQLHNLCVAAMWLSGQLTHYADVQCPETQDWAYSHTRIPNKNCHSNTRDGDTPRKKGVNQGCPIMYLLGIGRTEKHVEIANGHMDLLYCFEFNSSNSGMINADPYFQYYSRMFQGWKPYWIWNETLFSAKTWWIWEKTEAAEKATPPDFTADWLYWHQQVPSFISRLSHFFMVKWPHFRSTYPWLLWEMLNLARVQFFEGKELDTSPELSNNGIQWSCGKRNCLPLGQDPICTFWFLEVTWVCYKMVLSEPLKQSLEANKLVHYMF